MTPRVSLALLVLALFSANQPSARAAAQISTPVAGSTFSSSSVTFSWTAGGATNYALLVGSSLYRGDIYSSGLINALSATINNIPTDGRTIYVTLASNVSGSWSINNYTYTAATSLVTPTPTATPTPIATATPTATPTPVPISPPPPAQAAAQMSTPAPGSTFSSSSMTFNWTAGGATSYALLVGSSLYGHDIYSSGLINALSATVNNIPTDGRTIYVTLLSLVSGSWASNNYTYTAATSSATPTPTASPTPTATATPTPTPLSTPAPAASDPLTMADVQTIINRAVTRAVQVSPNSVIAVTDREGNVLAVWVVRGGAASNAEIATAVSKAGTAAFLSSNQNAFTSRTAGFIIQQHFPPGVNNTAPGPLVGVGLSNLFISDINKFRKPGSVISFNSQPGLTILPVPGTSLDGSPGGVPLYKNGVLVGGIGVTGDGTPPPIVGFRAENPFVFTAGADTDEDVALAGQRGYVPSSSITADNVFIGGIRLPYVATSTSASGTTVLQGNPDPQYPAILGAPAPFPYPIATFAGVTGEIRQPIINDPLSPGLINGQQRLTATEVSNIIYFAAQRVKITRAAIRLPIGTQMEVFITVVNNPNMPGVRPTVLGTFRTGEATFFSWDVAVQKARTALYYSSHDFLGFGLDIAMSTRCVGFLAECNYPPGIDGNSPGPFNGEQEMFSGLLGTHCAPKDILPNPAFVPDPNLPNGITIFPGGFPLYRNGVLVGAIGVSGDGVDQDDIVGASGTHDFLAPYSIRSDQFNFRGTRLPYAKFPRDPTL